MKSFLKNPRRTLRLAVSISVAACVAATVTLPLAGCGSSGGTMNLPGSGGTTRKTGSAEFRIRWPEKTRLIPLATQKIVVTLFKGNVQVRQGEATPPPDGVTPRESVISFDDLEPGNNYTARAEAFPDPAESPTILARKVSATPFTIADSDTPTQVRLTMDSTIDHLEIAVSKPDLPLITAEGRVRRLTVTAFDATGAIVLTTPMKVTFDPGPSGLVDVTQDDTTPETDADLTVPNPVAAEQTVTITATDTESTKSATVSFRVIPIGLNDQAAWPKFHGDERNQGLVVGSGPAGNGDGTVNGGLFFDTFSSGSGGIVFSSPAISDPATGTLYIGAYDGNLYAIQNGVQAWAVPTGGIIESSPAIGRDGEIFVGSYDGKLYGIEKDGSTRFAFQADGAVFGSPAVGPDGKVYFGTTDNPDAGLSGSTLYCIDGVTGEELWKYEAPEQGIHSAPAILDDGSGAVRIIFGSLDGRVYAVNQDGTPFAQPFDTGIRDAGFYSSSPAITSDGATLYIGSLDGKLYALNTASMTLQWEYLAGAPIYSTPAIAPMSGAIYFGTLDSFTGDEKGRLFSVTPGGQLTAGWVDAGDGQEGIRLGGPTGLSDAGPFITSSPVVDDNDNVYVGAYNNTVYAYTPAASPIWSFVVNNEVDGEGLPVNAAIESSLGFSDGKLYVGSLDGRVYVIGQTPPGPGRGVLRGAPRSGRKVQLHSRIPLRPRLRR